MAALIAMAALQYGGGTSYPDLRVGVGRVLLMGAEEAGVDSLPPIRTAGPSPVASPARERRKRSQTMSIKHAENAPDLVRSDTGVGGSTRRLSLSLSYIGRAKSSPNLGSARAPSSPNLGHARARSSTSITGLSPAERLRESQLAIRGGLRLGKQPSAAAQFVRPNLSGVRSMFVSDVHFSSDELAGVSERAQTPTLPWNPQPSGRSSANKEQLGVRALRDLGILGQVQDGQDIVTGPGSDDVREAFRLLTVVEPPRAALLSARVARAKPTLVDNVGASHLLLQLEVAALYAADDLKGAAAVLLEALSADGGSAGSFEVQQLYDRVIGKVRFHRQFFDKTAPRLPEVDVRPPTPEPEPEPEVFLGDEWEGRLRRLQDLWSVEADPQGALVALRGELRDRIAMLSQVYLAYCGVVAICIEIDEICI